MYLHYTKRLQAAFIYRIQYTMYCVYPPQPTRLLSSSSSSLGLSIGIVTTIPLLVFSVNPKKRKEEKRRNTRSEKGQKTNGTTHTNRNYDYDYDYQKRDRESFVNELCCHCHFKGNLQQMKFISSDEPGRC